MNFPCPKCSKQVRVCVDLFLDIPCSIYANLSKQRLRSSEVKIDGAGWDRARFYCSCGWFYRDGVDPPVLRPRTKCSACDGTGFVHGSCCRKCEGSMST